MDEGTSGGGESSSRVSPSYVKLGDRDVFTVELRPGETTFVSWKKLMRDANKVNCGSNSAPPEPPPAVVNPNIEARLGQGQPAETEGKDGPNRFSAVIEKIERLYMGKDSSDEEDLMDVPDDDQYDTDDSFIDDAELDEYFEVDDSAIKHDGFFVNRGKLERINKPTVEPSQQPKKRRRKDTNKASGENDDGHTSTKQAKTSKLAVSKAVIPVGGKNTVNAFQSLAVTSEHHDELKSKNLLNVSGVPSKRKTSEAKVNLDSSSSVKVSNGDTSVAIAESSDINESKNDVLPLKNITDKTKDASEHQDKSSYLQLKMQSSKSIANGDEVEPSARSKETNGGRELPDLNMPDGSVSLQVTKPSHIHKREGSSGKSKSSSLENAIRELEKMVSESRPPALDNQDADSSGQAIKRRLPREIKLKLAKVARLAASQGKVSPELLSRLMSILGHIMQLRTLKRNLKAMISMGSSAKQEKDEKFQKIKKEVAEMIKTLFPPESKALEQQAGASDDFQEVGVQDKGASKRKFSMDPVLEDKICDLYDLFVDGLDEDAGPQVRKLYVELAGLWPNGTMDNHGIKRAICRAKDRRRALHNKNKEHEKMKRKKAMEPDTSGPERLANNTNGPVLSLVCNSVPGSTTAAEPNLLVNAPKGSSSSEAKTEADAALVKKKAKRKPELDINETQCVSGSSETRN